MHGRVRQTAGLRAAWERQQQRGALEEAVRRMPRQGDCKALLLAAQLQPVLRTAGGCASGQGGSEGAVSADDIGEAAEHLERLACVDGQAPANRALLLWLLLLPHGRCTGWAARLVTAAEWEPLLALALPWLPDWRALVAAGHDQLQHEGLQLVALRLLSTRLCELLLIQQHQQQQPGEELLNSLQLMQQVLLAWPAAATAAAAHLRQAQAAVEASIQSSLAAIQQQQQQQQQLDDRTGERQQAVFQQLCQMRARLALALVQCAPGDAATSTLEEEDAAVPAGVQPELHSELDGLAAGAWPALLELSSGLASAAGGAVPAQAGSTQVPLLLAARAVAACLSGCLPCLDGREAQEEHPALQESLVSVLPAAPTLVPGLPGASFPAAVVPPALAKQRWCEQQEARPCAVAARLLTADPSALSPARLTLAVLEMLQEQAAAPDLYPLHLCGRQEAQQAWVLLLALARSAAGRVEERAQQHALLELGLLSPHFAALRHALHSDQALQDSSGRQLVGVSNHLTAADEGGSRGGATAGAASVAVAPARVFGEDAAARRRRVAAAVREVLPHALLCPEATLERVVKDAVLHPGQAELLADVLGELAPLLRFPSSGSAGTGMQGSGAPCLLLKLLASSLVHPLPSAGASGREVAASFVVKLCERFGSGASGVAPAASARDQQSPAVKPADVLRHVVVPALRTLRGGDLLGPLQLAAALLLAGDGGGRLDAGAAGAELAALLSSLLDLSRRRTDASARGLDTPLEAYQLAWELLHHCVPQPTIAAAGAAPTSALVGGATPPLEVGAYLWSRLLPALQQGGLAALRGAVVAEVGALLPACTQHEAQQVLCITLPALIATALDPGSVPGDAEAAASAATAAAGPQAVALQAAAFEAAVRAVHALALQPDVVCLAGEQDERREGAAGAVASGDGSPSLLRRIAVERTLQHLCWFASRLTAAEHPATTWPAVEGEQGEEEERKQRVALGLRCFRHLCQLTAAVQPHYEASTLQVCLVHLVQQLLVLAGEGPGTRGGSSGQLQQVALAEMWAAARGLEGSTWDIVRLALETTAGATA
eukprot:scaffold1.g5652.t1